jgi:hypothetical protein
MAELNSPAPKDLWLIHTVQSMLLTVYGTFIRLTIRSKDTISDCAT